MKWVRSGFSGVDMKWVRSGLSVVSALVSWYGVLTVRSKLEVAQVVPADQTWLLEDVNWFLWQIAALVGFHLVISLFHFLVRPTNWLWLSRVLLLAGSINGLSCLNWAALTDLDNVVILFQVGDVALVNPAGLALKRQDVITAVTTAVMTAVSITPNLLPAPQLQGKLAQFHNTLYAALTDEAVTFTSKANLIAGQLARLNIEVATWVTEPLPPPVKWTWLAGTVVTLAVAAGMGYLGYQVGCLKSEITFLEDQQSAIDELLKETKRKVDNFPEVFIEATEDRLLTPRDRRALTFFTGYLRQQFGWG